MLILTNLRMLCRKVCLGENKMILRVNLSNQIRFHIRYTLDRNDFCSISNIYNEIKNLKDKNTTYPFVSLMSYSNI